MSILPKSVQNLIDQFSRFPGVGPKTASRLVFYLLNQEKEGIDELGNAVLAVNKNIVKCQKCYNLSDSNLCSLCGSISRDKKTLMIVEESLDIVALEKTDYQGLYFVLGGLISPIDDVSPEDLRVNELIKRLSDKTIKEMILATDPSLEGEATAMYLTKEVEKYQNLGKIDKKLQITRIARGLPVGSDLEYADEVTLMRSLEGRKKFN
ncbi:recombination protein RecR [Candidatus Berkelbacteria bacterium CG_4_8_14_3_um_filter_33_6]|nr:MAG: recombination protein RecR [Candidatus Berkelbacteria bacterium CG23_combo_of_CG06-09_8_20_14_all_33_15]PIS08494.1 MAG: recombination protein RecR [Candidatus Berkelbacteria bacterium CG10_big_fil_rev_8_21_14_0_10_33_10]PIX31313.1 MAG: recombination protein RecR [Candidatus Berkelbacteria bacterium CG_4_8_14_3_um_filter_33_6]PIZ28542.1 MAG: recombination protein RecR [Candidatus Berkelbacteria bacterium CG_4_10_14_0_8_um_filter_35_9_33_8]PJB51938.1 MAG: recombination protein RecR [Candi